MKLTNSTLTDCFVMQVFFNFLTVVTARHYKALMGFWMKHIPDAESGRSLQSVAKDIQTASTGDAKFKSYVNLVLGLINHSMQV